MGDFLKDFMPNETWIKLYRKVLQNDALFRSAHTFTVWCWLLLMADHETGIVKCGRFQISQWLKIKPSTVYLALKRLENLTMIQMKPDNKMTTITILNWCRYQMKPDNKITTTKQQNNTIQEIRIKNISNTNTQSGGDELINKSLEAFKAMTGFQPTDKKPRYEAFNLLRRIKKTIKEMGKEDSQENSKIVLTKYLQWISKQEWSKGLQLMSTVRLKYPIYESLIKEKHV